MISRRSILRSLVACMVVPASIVCAPVRWRVEDQRVWRVRCDSIWLAMRVAAERWPLATFYHSYHSEQPGEWVILGGPDGDGGLGKWVIG